MQSNTQSTNQQTHNRSLSGTASMLTNQISDLTSNFSLKNNPISSSPAKNVSSFLSRATSITSSVTSNVAGVAGRISSGIKDIGGKSKVLLIIDDCQTDWSKYFRVKRLVGDYDIRVEQTEFRDISIHSHSEYGTIFSLNSDKSTPKRQVKPDFVFVRQHVKDSQDDFTSIILGLKYGNIPSVNSLLSIYNFIDRPLIFSELINIQRRIGKENFPLIEQTFYPSYKEMLNNPPKFPCVIKMGHSHGGLGKLRADSLVHFQELLSVLACINVYLTVEPYIDAKCDVHIQKIGNNYKAFMRKSISGGWKSNMGSAVLEQIQITDKHKMWADEVSKLFGGLDLLTIEIVETKNNEQFIYEVTGSQMTLMGETQEEDRRLISDLITLKMQHYLNSSRDSLPKKNSLTQAQSEELSTVTQQVESPQPTFKPTGQQSFLKRMGSISGSISNTITSVASNAPGTSLLVGNKSDPNNSTENPNSQQTSTTGQIQQQVTDTVDRTAQQIRGLFRRNSQSTNEEGIVNPNATNTDDGDDTMKNLRKTFAGIFGDG